MSKENQGFVVKDSRYFTEEGKPRSEQPMTESRKEGQDLPPRLTKKQKEKTSLHPPASVDFSSLILSLSHAAMLQLGILTSSGNEKNDPDLELARYSIDTIGMLKDKTAGNLTQDEQRLIENVLTELRLAFIRASA